MAAIEKFFTTLRSRNRVAYIPKRVWEAYQAGLLKFVGTHVAPWRTAQLGFAFLGPGPSPTPTFTNETEWTEVLSALNMKVPSSPYSYKKLPIKSVPNEGEVLDLTVLPLHFLQIWDEGGKFEGKPEPDEMRRLRQEFGLEVWSVHYRGYLQSFEGAIVVCRAQYSPQELQKTRRRVEDRLRKNDADAIRVAKFLKLK